MFFIFIFGQYGREVETKRDLQVKEKGRVYHPSSTDGVSKDSPVVK